MSWCTIMPSVVAIVRADSGMMLSMLISECWVEITARESAERRRRTCPTGRESFVHAIPLEEMYAEVEPTARSIPRSCAMLEIGSIIASVAVEHCWKLAPPSSEHQRPLVVPMTTVGTAIAMSNAWAVGGNIPLRAQLIPPLIER